MDRLTESQVTLELQTRDLLQDTRPTLLENAIQQSQERAVLVEVELLEELREKLSELDASEELLEITTKLFGPLDVKEQITQ